MTAIRRFRPSRSARRAQPRRLRAQLGPDRRGKRQRQMGQRAERISAPQRPHPQPRRDGEGLCQAGKRRADRGHRGARRADRDPAQRRRSRPIRPRCAPSTRRRASSAVRSAALLRSGDFEAYPDLKSNENFLTLQSQIEGTENSILVSRRDYNEAVQAYNTRIRTFPDAIGAKVFYGAKPKVPFEAAAGSDKAPKVDFDTAS